MAVSTVTATIWLKAGVLPSGPSAQVGMEVGTPRSPHADTAGSLAWSSRQAWGLSRRTWGLPLRGPESLFTQKLVWFHFFPPNPPKTATPPLERL